MDQNDFLKGALVGGVLGGVAALLLASKSGKDLRDDICNGYNCITQQSHDMADSVKDHAHKLLNTLQGIEEPHSHQSSLAGGAIGAIIGAVSALLLAPKPGHKLREDLGDSYHDLQNRAEKTIKGLDKSFTRTRHTVEEKMEDWKDIFSTLVEKLSQAKADKKSSKSHDLFELASLGLRLYDQFQKRK